MTNPGLISSGLNLANDNANSNRGLKKVLSGTNLSAEEPSTQRNLTENDEATIDDQIDYISLFKDEDECLNIMRQIESDNLVKIHELQTLEQDITIQSSALNKSSHDLKSQLNKLENNIQELKTKKEIIEKKIMTTKKKNWQIVSSDAQEKDEKEVKIIFDKIRQLSVSFCDKDELPTIVTIPNPSSNPTTKASGFSNQNT